MADTGKFLTIQNGAYKEERGVQTSAGAADANKLARLNALGQWDESMLPNAEIQSKTAAENINAGEFIHVKSDGQVEKADATNTAKPASGFTRAAISISTAGNVYGEGIIGGFVGLTIGAPVYLSTIAGGVTQTAPSGSGNIVQKLGTAWSATEVKVEIGEPVELV